jgi:predicted PurR-regulated permease PerM
MEVSNTSTTFSSRRIIEIAVQLLALSVIIVWCFRIIESFVTPLVWGGILAVALYPLFDRLKKILKGRGALAAVILTGSLLLILIVPAILLGIRTANEMKTFVVSYNNGQLHIPPVPSKVKDWPLIGTKVDALWNQASTNMQTLIQQYPEKTKEIVSKGLGILSGAVKGILLFTLSIIISGGFLYYATSSEKFTRSLFKRLMGNSKLDMAGLTAITIRSVVKGILGVAVIQSALAYIGFLGAGIPGSGILTLICFLLAIVQIGILPVSIGVLIYIWGSASTLKATLLTIWLIIVGVSDNILKPWLLSKGGAVPMLVIFLGSVGGFIYSGFIGLFTGAIIFSLGYKLLVAWIEGSEI